MEIKNQISFLLAETDRYHRSAVDTLTAKFKLHRTQFTTIHFISLCKKAPNQTEIADAFGVSTAAVAVTLKKLEQEGFIERSVGNSDNREKRIFLTKKAENLLNDTHRAFESVNEIMCRDISEEEIEILKKLLNKMQENLKTLSPDIEAFPPIHERKFK